MLTERDIQNKWSEIKAGIQNIWGKITNEEIENTKGNVYAISDVVHEKYGEAIDSIQDKLNRLLASFDNETDKKRDKGSSSFMRNPTSERNSKADDRIARH
jgi:uncharacterized protein YjbJ (UPF0337 family)